MVFSNFAFFINTTETNNNHAINVLFEWFKSRSLGFMFYDQDVKNNIAGYDEYNAPNSVELALNIPV